MSTKRLLVFALVILMFAALAFPASATPAGEDGEHKVLVCHATGSANNPFVVVDIDEAGWLHGHIDHLGDKLTLSVDPAGCEEPGG